MQDCENLTDNNFTTMAWTMVVVVRVCDESRPVRWLILAGIHVVSMLEDCLMGKHPHGL